ncbi:MAG: RNA polymerase sigma factor [bacterium]|jgi:RNA polymerase sporulation-specific sigma factor
MKDIVTNEELVKLYRAGDPSALEALYLRNYGLIRQIVIRLCPGGNQQDIEDEMQEAFFALVEAVKAFPEGQDVKLTTYISNCIKWHKSRRYQFDRKRNPENLISLDEPLPGIEGNITLGDTVVDPDAEFEEGCVNRVAYQKIQDRLDSLIDEILSKRESDVIRRRMSGKTQAEISQEIGLAQNVVGQYERMAYEKIRNRKNDKKLQEILDYYDLQSYKRVGFAFWRDTGYSSVEWAAEKKMEVEAKWLKRGEDSD